MTVLRRPSVLVVGSGSAANTLANLLTALDCGVTSWPDARDVLPARHDLVFVDLDASGVDGWDLARRVHRTREQGPVILLHGGVVTLANTDRAERLGARLMPTPTTLREFWILFERAFRAADTWREPAQVS
jgi:FixJ family two-component response regulator